MKSIQEIIKRLKNFISDNKISIYKIATISGINRSTLQKALSGDRTLNIRQFKSLLDCLPITNTEKNNLYNDYVKLYLGDKKINIIETILDILETINNSINQKNYPLHNSDYEYTIDFHHINGKQNVIETTKNITLKILSSNPVEKLCAYLPFDSDFFTISVAHSIDKCSNNANASVLFELLKPDNSKSHINTTILKNILPLLLNENDIYNLRYVYVDSYFYDNHLTPYPYYIIYSDMALLLNDKLDDMIVITDKEVVAYMQSVHIKKNAQATLLNVTKLKLDDCITHLMTNQVSNDMYAISFEPCISSFASPEMYAELIKDDFPNKSDFLALINNRIQDITQMPKKYALFNAESIVKFANDGNLLIFEHPYLKNCNTKQKIEVLSNILNTMDDKTVIMRAYNITDVNVSPNFEITNVQNLYDFSILVYQDNGVRLIDIHEPIISRYFIDFVHSILETPLVYTYEETRKLILDTIKDLEQKLDK